MSQITQKKILKKIAHYWPDENPEHILKILNGYGIEEYVRESTRVLLAIIKLSEGDKNRLEDLVTMAKTDYRDVLAYAEYPEEMRTGFVEMREMSDEEVIAIRQRDREVYLSWLEG